MRCKDCRDYDPTGFGEGWGSCRATYPNQDGDWPPVKGDRDWCAQFTPTTDAQCKLCRYWVLPTCANPFALCTRGGPIGGFLRCEHFETGEGETL